MIWRMYEGPDVMPKFVACGCPKHGLHLLAMMIEGCVARHPESIYNRNHWIGNHMFNSFTLAEQKMGRWFFMASRLQQGQYMQGHISYKPDISDFLRKSRVAFVFIYRDLRDVAVSMMYHALDDDKNKFKHPAKGAYRALREQDGEDAVLSAIIEGMGPFPSVVKLWDAYAPWLGQAWVHSMKYEDILEDRQAAAEGILEYGMDQITRDIWEVPFRVEKSVFDQAVTSMVNLSQQTGLSPTFRKGGHGGWREHFTDEHKELFKQHDPGWLVRLGYEQDNDW